MNLEKEINNLSWFNLIEKLKSVLKKMSGNGDIDLGYKELTLRIISNNYEDQLSGTLEVGKTYLTDGVEAGDDFTNVGWVADNVEFVATGEVPNNWTNSSYVVNISDSGYEFEIIKNEFEGVDLVFDYDYNTGGEFTLSQPILTDSKTVILVGNQGNNTPNVVINSTSTFLFTALPDNIAIVRVYN